MKGGSGPTDNLLPMLNQLFLRMNEFDIQSLLSEIKETRTYAMGSTGGFNPDTCKNFIDKLGEIFDQIQKCKGIHASLEYRSTREAIPVSPFDTTVFSSNRQNFENALAWKIDESNKIKESLYFCELRKKRVMFGNVTIGGGFCGTANWYFRKKLGLYKDDDLCIARDEGNWTENNYVFAQRHSTLDNVYYKWNAKDFVNGDKWMQDPFVRAPDYYKAQVLNQQAMGMKFLQGNVLKIEFIDEKDIIEKGYIYKLTIIYSYGDLENGIWQIYCKSIDLCTGQGTATSISSMNMEPVFGNSVEDGIRNIIRGLSLTIENLNRQEIPRLINANDYVLHDKYKTKGKSIVIYGSGGTANAAARKAILGDDDGRPVSEFIRDPVNDVRLFARKNFNASGKGDLVNETFNYLNIKDRLYKDHPIERVRIGRDNKFEIKFKDDANIYKADIFIYAIGQNELGNNQMTGVSEILPLKVKNELRITDGEKSVSCDSNNVGFIPTGLHFKESLFIHGSSAITKLNLSEEGGDQCIITRLQSNFNLFLPEDNKYPSTMPISLSLMKSFYHKKYDRGDLLLDNINLNVDTLEIITKFFRKHIKPLEKKDIRRIISETIRIGSQLWNYKEYVLCVMLYSYVIDFFNRLGYTSVQSNKITRSLIIKKLQEIEKMSEAEQLESLPEGNIIELKGWMYRFVLVYLVKESD